MKSKKKFVLAGLALLAIVLLLPLAGCDTNSGSDKHQVTTYTVTFNSNGGSAVTSQKVESGQKATKHLWGLCPAGVFLVVSR